MGISIDRLAMTIESGDKRVVEHHLERFGFSPAEISEIISQCMVWGSGRLTRDWKMIAVNIKSTMECSLRIGDRFDFSIG